MNFLKKIDEIKSDKELQAELKALVMLFLADQQISYDNGKRYEKLLKEIYLRGLEPELTIKPRL